jgi:glycosyltransferase involved in cell wall biosynthesis
MEMKLPKLKKINPNNPNKPKKKKILLLSDDLRLHSGIGTMSREFAIGTVGKYDWAQIGGAVKHPDQGKIFDLSEETKKITGVEDPYIKVYPVSGYGNPDILRQVMTMEQPDAILHFTDPRFWGWLYQMEHELRQHTPLLYYNIWDDLPDPQWNEDFYESCDLIMAISKQTYGINKRVRKRKPVKDWELTYVPHGINEESYRPILETEQDLIDKKRKEIFGDNEIDFVVFWNNRNIRRKVPGDVILAFKTFCDQLKPEQAKRCALVMHTQPIDENGTNLPEVVRMICPKYKVVLHDKRVDASELNLLYNIADVTVNMASNEGFGLSGAESLMAGTPIINNVTGGLQDQCGFHYEQAETWDSEGITTSLKEKYFTAEDYVEIGSLHDRKKWEGAIKSGKWAKPVWPSNRSLQGSVPTPYIFDDRCSFEDVGDKLMEWYETPRAERVEAGLKGREFAMKPEIGMSSKSGMCKLMADSIDNTFKNWTARKRFSIIAA